MFPPGDVALAVSPIGAPGATLWAGGVICTDGLPTMVTVAVAKAEVWPRLSVTVHPKVKMVPAAGADLSATSTADVSAAGAGLGPTGNFCVLSISIVVAPVAPAAAGVPARGCCTCRRHKYSPVRLLE